MRLYDSEGQRTLRSLLLLLTEDEATQLRDYLSQQLLATEASPHDHVTDKSFTHELTIAIYDENGYETSGLADRVKDVIRDDR